MSGSISLDMGDGAMGAYCALPVNAPAPAVVVLHEVFGVNADMRATCDTLAVKGFIAICPDLFWRQEPGQDLSVTSEADWNKGLALYAAFDRDRGALDIGKVVQAALTLDGASGKVAVLGYCLGGLMAFLVAARSHVDATVAFHGADTEKYLSEARSITAPLLMHLAGRDEFMPAQARHDIQAALAGMPDVQIHEYADCSHAFSRHGGAHYDPDAAALANQRTWSFLTRELG